MATNTPLQSITLTSASSSVTFSNIDQTYTDLVLIPSVKNSSSEQSLAMWFNGDTASNYSATFLYGNGSSALSGRDTSNTLIPITRSDTSAFWVGTVSIQNYPNSSTYKTALSRGNSGTIVISQFGLWRSTAAITSITISGLSGNSFAAGSTFDLYGIKAGSPKASGGNTITTDGTYWYHTFTSSGTFIPTQSLTADYLVIAGGGGGGGGGGDSGGGGGAGGLRSTVTATGGGGTLETALSLSGNTNYTVTVGAGGVRGFSGTSTFSGSGSNSVFSTITSVGGGGGGGYRNSGGSYGGTTGGSGGGGHDGGTGPGSGTANQGYAGGAGSNISTHYAGGGGGGAGGVGGSGVSSTGIAGTGGLGVDVSITGASVTYAGGGGGSANPGTAGGAGRAGGGTGATGTGSAGTAATANTGSGGGGGSTAGGGAGGSGIVIVRYLV